MFGKVLDRSMTKERRKMLKLFLLEGLDLLANCRATPLGDALRSNYARDGTLRLSLFVAEEIFDIIRVLWHTSSQSVSETRNCDPPCKPRTDTDIVMQGMAHCNGFGLALWR